MFSHVVLFWTKPEIEDAPAKLAAGIEKYLRPIPNAVFFHTGKMAPSPRPVVEQSYQLGLNVVFNSRAEHDAYQSHPLHIEFLEKSFRPLCAKVVVYDFE